MLCRTIASKRQRTHFVCSVTPMLAVVNVAGRHCSVPFNQTKRETRRLVPSLMKSLLSPQFGQGSPSYSACTFTLLLVQNKHQELKSAVLTFPITKHPVVSRGQGMVHEPPLHTADRSICFSPHRSRAGKRSTNPASLGERSNLFARSSIWFVARSSARSPSTFHFL